MSHRSAIRLIGALACAGALLVAANDAMAADRHHRGGGGGFHRGGGFHHHHAHFHSFVFLGAGYGVGAYPYYGAYPAYYPPPTYVSRDECYQPPVPRSPGVADLYTCSGQYVGAIAVP